MKHRPTGDTRMYYIEFVAFACTWKVMCWNQGRPVTIRRGLTRQQAEACVAQR
jgi:hypothetical protein